MTAEPLGIDAPEPGAGPGLLRRFLSRPQVIVALVVLGIFAVLAVIAPFTLRAPTALDVPHRFAAPTLAHPFGTDELGRDLLSRIANAGQLSLGIAAGATVVSLVLGTVWGLAAAARSGWLDEVLMRLAEAAMAIPIILFALVFVAAFGANLVAMTLVAGLLMSPLTARVARSSVLAELSSEYVHGLDAVGVPRQRILFTEVLPNTVPALLAQASLNVATSLMLEATLSFVGLGVQPPDASWGTLLQNGYSHLYESIWYPLLPALVIIAAIAALNTLGSQLQKVLYRSGS
jgi:ABC-type dipeptide/oligopeptide/nickel transport system permease subunit